MAAKSKNRREPTETLSLPERFYIENHGDLSVEQLAKELNKPVKLVQEYCEAWLKANPVKKESKVSKLMNKFKGSVSMTEAASIASDDAIHHVTLEEINIALANGQITLANSLKERYYAQEQANKSVFRNQYANIIHYIQPLTEGDNGIM